MSKVLTLLAALLTGCTGISQAFFSPTGLIIEREPPNQVAEISYEIGSTTDVLRVMLGKVYHAVQGVEIQTGNELGLIAEKDPQPTIISKKWVDDETYSFELPHAAFVGTVRITNAQGHLAIDMSRAKVEPRFLAVRGYELLVIDPASPSL